MVEAIVGLDNMFSASNYLEKDGLTETSFAFSNAVFSGAHR